MNKGLLKGVLVVVGATTVSVLGLFASDGLRGLEHDLTALTGGSAVCGSGMVEMQYEGRKLCVDQYEASPSAGCTHQNPRSVVETEANLRSGNCHSVSREGADPWRFVSLPQAQRLCAAVGKRLPSSDEWYRSALGSENGDCVTDAAGPSPAGTHECRSAVGVYDAIGNLWEWTDEQVNGLEFDGRTLPAEGYVSEVDASGIAVSTGESADELYGEDYFWSKDDGVFGMIRGGFYGSETDAGLYAVNTSVSTSFASPGIGFRCVKDA